jgi:hypothetical protein
VLGDRGGRWWAAGGITKHKQGLSPPWCCLLTATAAAAALVTSREGSELAHHGLVVAAAAAAIDLPLRTPPDERGAVVAALLHGRHQHAALQCLVGCLGLRLGLAAMLRVETPSGATTARLVPPAQERLQYTSVCIVAGRPAAGAGPAAGCLAACACCLAAWACCLCLLLIGGLADWACRPAASLGGGRHSARSSSRRF